jgi:hypothetical protein
VPRISASVSLRGRDGHHFLHRVEIEVSPDGVAPLLYEGRSYTYSHSIELGNFRDTDGLVYVFVQADGAA